MNAEHLLTHFDRIADAPDAVPRLRRFILDLAVRGKLVGQDSNDEPAAELLKRIAAEKERLAKAGEIGKPKPLLPLFGKVDELMSLCDRLEASLATGDEMRGRLIDTLLHEALESDEEQAEAGWRQG